MILPFKWNVGSKLGDGKQYLPWIHLDDLIQIYLKSITDQNMTGAYNAVAPDHVTNSEFTTLLAKNLRKKLWAPAVPSFIIKLLFGEMGNLVLKGSRISSEKLIRAGHNFVCQKLDDTLEKILSVKK
ncbi:MAG: DUF1731 domain-containing protein [Crocinitomicaceae bacterium]|nr:DUF1731 domain-containing protein [Crocinitomicaceae bacterium]